MKGIVEEMSSMMGEKPPITPIATAL